MKRTLTMIASLFLLMSVAIPTMAAQGPITINYVTFVPRMHAIAKVLEEDLKACVQLPGRPRIHEGTRPGHGRKDGRRGHDLHIT
jgi:hypothetical protein